MKTMKQFGRLYISQSYVRYQRIGIRKYSASDSSALNLAITIEHVYNYLKNRTRLSMSTSEFNIIKEKILLGHSILSPLRFQGVYKKNLRKYLSKVIDDFPDLMYYPSYDNPDFYIVIMPEKEDNLVLIGLSRMLYRQLEGGFSYDFTLAEKVKEEEERFYSNIEQMDNVNRLFYIDLSPTDFSAFEILNMIKSYVKEYSVCYTLIKSFLNLPYKNSDGSIVFINRSLLAGEISILLKNLAFHNSFDIPFTRELAGIAYERYMGHVIIPTKADDEYIFDEYTANMLIGILGLDATINYIEPGDEPIQCGSKRVGLNKDGKVFVY